MSDEQFDQLLARLDGMHAEMTLGLAEVKATLGTLAVGQVNLFNMVVQHVSDRGVHGN